MGSAQFLEMKRGCLETSASLETVFENRVTSNPHCLSAGKKVHKEGYLREIPPELLDMIFGMLDVFDLRRLKLISKWMKVLDCGD